MRDYVERYGDERIRRHADALIGMLAKGEPRPTRLDEFDAVGAASVDELRDRFAPHFYFGCEADDPMVAWAFAHELNPGGAELRPLFSSDVGHWDVTNMNEVLSEAHELVDDGHLDAAQFRRFTFENAVRFYACVDPGFFDGTVVEREAASVLGAPDAG